VETLPAGSRVDTSAPVRCSASDAELATGGQAACPAGSRVGSGEVDLDSGFGVLSFNVTEFNSQDELILLFESKDGSMRTPSRATVEGARADGPRITIDAPPIPGGPPDGFTAIKRVRLGLQALTTGQGAGRKSYVTTPRSCPAAGSWTSKIEFTYRDAQTQTTRSSSPCNKGSNPATDRSAPRITIRGVPRRCASRGFRARVRIRDSSRLRRAHGRLDGRLVRRTKRKGFTLRVSTRGLRAGRHRLSVVVRDQAGNRAKRIVRFRVCG
jgi:hypothetical protein